jgi:hypothetical protein
MHLSILHEEANAFFSCDVIDKCELNCQYDEETLIGFKNNFVNFN